jgi:hypothetical protein
VSAAEPLVVFPVPSGQTWRIQAVWRGPPASRNQVVTELSEARSRKLHFDLYGAATASCDLDGHSAEGTAIQELSQDLAWWRFNVDVGAYEPYFRGPIGHSEDTLDGTAHTLNLQAADYRAMLGRSIVSAYSPTGIAQEIIVGNIVAPFTALGTYPQNLGVFNRGMYDPTGQNPTTSGTNRTLVYQGTEQVAAEIDKLATMQGGFEWGCDPVTWNAQDPAAYVATMTLYYPQRGVTKGFVAEYGANVTAVKRTVDSTGFSNWVQYTGQSGTAAQVASGDVMANPQLHAEGLWQLTKADANVSDTSQLLAEAQFDLAFDSVLTPSYTLTLVPGAWRSRADCWLGDTIRVRVTSGRLSVDINVRIVQVDITIDDAGNETVALVVARPPQTLAGVLGAQTQNLYQLNRR